MIASTRWRIVLGAMLLVGLASCTVLPDTARQTAPPAPVVVATPPRAAPEARDWTLAAATEQGTILRGIAPAGTRSLSLDGDPVPVADDGAFIIGFDRDAAAGATLVATLADGSTATRTVAVARGAWDIQNIDASLTGGVSSEEFRRRRAGELARIVAARARDTGAAGWRQEFIWPAEGRISGVFGSQRIYRGTPASYHSGVDIAAGAGTPFRAPADGIVILAAEDGFTLEGHLLMIDHGHGLNSAFLHCSKLYVREGQAVRRGQLIGEVGSTGRATGPHLHWSMKLGPARVDPRKLATPAR